MESARRWWERYSLQLVLVALGLCIAAALRQTQGMALMEVYQVLSSPFQSTYSEDEQLADARLRELQYRITELENQNQRFKVLLGEKPNTRTEDNWSAVIGRSADSWWHQIIIGKGSNNGVTLGAIAVGPGGLVGRVTDVFPNSSRVLLISDPTSQVGASISRSRQIGILRGQTQNMAVLEFFERDPDVKPGDIVLTSAFSSLYPAGIPIGRVRSVNVDKQPAPEAVVEFSVPIGLLEFVRIYPYTPQN